MTKIRLAILSLVARYISMHRADQEIALIISKVMLRLVDKKQGFPVSYLEEFEGLDDEKVKEKCDNGYKKFSNDLKYYSSLFEEYSKEGIAINDKIKKKYGGLSEEEYEDMMKWLSEYFPHFFSILS